MSVLARLEAAIPPHDPELEQTCEVGDADLRAVVALVAACEAYRAKMHSRWDFSEAFGDAEYEAMVAALAAVTA